MGAMKLRCFFWLLRLVKDVGLNLGCSLWQKMVCLVVREVGKSGFYLNSENEFLCLFCFLFSLHFLFYPMDYGLKVRRKGSMWGFIECLYGG